MRIKYICEDNKQDFGSQINGAGTEYQGSTTNRSRTLIVKSMALALSIRFQIAFRAEDSENIEKKDFRENSK